MMFGWLAEIWRGATGDATAYAVTAPIRSSDAHRRAHPGLGPHEWHVVARTENEARELVRAIAWHFRDNSPNYLSRRDMTAWPVRALDAETNAMRDGWDNDRRTSRRLRDEARELNVGW